MKKFLSVLMAVAMMLTIVMAFAGCSSSSNNSTEDTSGESVASSDESAASSENSDLAYIKEKGTLVIGVTVYEPMNYKDESGEWTGFDTEYAQAVCEKLGVKPEFIVIDWDNKFLELEAKTIDCIWNGMTITDEVKLNSSVTDPYVKNAQVVVTTADVQAKYTTLSEMTDLSFAAEAGSAGAEALDDAGMEYTAVSDQASALMEIASGSADACVIDLTMANAMTGEGTSYADLVQAEELNEEEYGIACRKDSDLTKEINSITDELIANGKMDSLAEKYELTVIK